MFGSGFVAPNDFVACALTVPSNFVTVAMWWDGFAFAKLVGQQMRECYYHRIIIRLPPVSADPSWMIPLLQYSFLPPYSTGKQRTWLQNFTPRNLCDGKRLKSAPNNLFRVTQPSSPPWISFQRFIPRNLRHGKRVGSASSKVALIYNVIRFVLPAKHFWSAGARAITV